MTARKDDKTKAHALRDNLESIAVAILLALLIRQVVVEAFKIPTGSMAPTLLGVHKEVECPNCGWSFNVGSSELAASHGYVECSNCHWVWDGASSYCAGRRRVDMKQPLPWIWNQGRCPGTGEVFRGREGANRVMRGGSRILVSKFSYKLPWREPRRWEVVVFLFPQLDVRCERCLYEWKSRRVPERCIECRSRDIHVERRNFIKRLVGLPDEELQLLGGDVYVDGRIKRKPVNVQRGIWLHVFDSLYWPRRTPEQTWPFGKIFVGDERYWSREDGQFLLDPPAGGDAVLIRFGRPVTDHYGYDAVGVNAAGADAVSGGYRVDDLALVLRLVPERPGTLILALAGRYGNLTASIPLGSGGGTSARAELRLEGETVAATALGSLPVGEEAEIALWQHDGSAHLLRSGQVVLEHEFAPERIAADPDAPQVPQQVLFGAHGAKLRIRRIQIKRDIYYTPGNGNLSEPIRIKSGHYVFLGDNSPDSNDSRSWDDPQVPRSHIAGRAFFSFWPVDDARPLPRALRPEDH